MRKIKILLTTISIATLVVSGMVTNMIQNETNVKAETESDNIYGTEGDYYYEILNDGTIKIIGYNRIYQSDIVAPDWAKVPDKIDGKNVTCIGKGAFQNCRGVTDIELPDSVTTIESYAFAGSEAAITIPSGVNSIGSWAFSGCSYVYIRTNNDVLGTLTIPQGVNRIEEGTFSNCTWLEEVVIPSGVVSIGNQAFDGCDALQSVAIPNTVTSVGEKAFYNCTELTYIKIPANATVGKDAFGGCDKLKIEYETEKSPEDATTDETIKETKTEVLTTERNTINEELNTTTECTITKPITITPEATATKVSVARTKVKKVTKKIASKKAKIFLKKVNGAIYEVKISTTKKFKNKNTVTKKVKKATFTVSNKKLKDKKIIYVRARAYKVVKGKTYYSEWSKIKKVKLKK